LVSLFIYLVDPRLERPEVAVLVVTLSLILVGILVGYHSRGETIRETALAGLLVLALTAVGAVGILGIRIPGVVWLLSPFYATSLAMAGGWVGEMLQGTLEEAHEDEPVDWPWVFVSIVIGFTLSAYAVFLGRALLDMTLAQSLFVFAASFLVTGWIIGFKSPGVTMVEPAIAAATMIVLDAGFVIIWFAGNLDLVQLLIGFGCGVPLALVGGWLGEWTQRLAQSRRGR
jgi:hypothetical protein